MSFDVVIVKAQNAPIAAVTDLSVTITINPITLSLTTLKFW